MHDLGAGPRVPTSSDAMLTSQQLFNILHHFKDGDFFSDSEMLLALIRCEMPLYRASSELLCAEISYNVLIKQAHIRLFGVAASDNAAAAVDAASASPVAQDWLLLTCLQHCHSDDD